MTTLVAALSLHQAGRAAEAAALYRKILAEEPGNTDALYLLGILSRQAQRPKLAIDLIRHAIALKQGVAQYHNHLGEAFLDVGDIEQGRTSFMRALQLKPRYLEAMLNLGGLLAMTGKHVEAAMIYAGALRLSPNHEQAASRLKELSRGLAGKEIGLLLGANGAQLRTAARR